MRLLGPLSKTDHQIFSIMTLKQKLSIYNDIDFIQGLGLAQKMTYHIL
jgi:hypothetical protein